MARILFALDRTGQLNGAAVQKELFRQCRFTTNAWKVQDFRMMGMTKYFAVSWYFIRRDHKIYGKGIGKR